MTGMRQPEPRRSQTRRVWIRRALLVLAVVGLVIAWMAPPYVRSAALLMDMTGAAPGLRRWLPVSVPAVQTRDMSVPTRGGDMPVRVYRSPTDRGPTIVIFPGVHGGGLDEPRLVALSRRIAATGATVLSAPLPDLRRYTVTPRATDMLEDVVVWTTSHPEMAADGRVGVVGVSFAGGLALVAAGRPRLAGKITAVFALGAHGDLPRVMRYLCLADGAPKTLKPPHDYGVVVILRSSIPKLVPAEQVSALDTAVVTFLDASSAEATDPQTAARLFENARNAELALPEPSRGLMHAVNTRDVATLGRALAPLAESIGGDPALSPLRSPATSSPVFLLHGADDNVIPSSETPLLADYLSQHGNPRVTMLLTPLLTHAEARPSAGVLDLWRLINFWTKMWRTYEVG